MRALIVCSVHALCDVAWFEKEAFNLACQRFGIPAIMTAQDHVALLQRSTMLGFLNQLSGSAKCRLKLIETYLEILNDHVWSTSLNARPSVLTDLLDRSAFTRPTGFLSDYPILTTNLIRSSALITNSTRLGTLIVPSCPMTLQGTAAGLMALAGALDVAHENTDVLVDHKRDYDAALSIGMRPRFVSGSASDTSCTDKIVVEPEIDPTIKIDDFFQASPAYFASA